MVPFVLGAAMEAVGYFLRRASAGSPTQTGLYIGQTLPIILAPAFLAASVYMSFGRVIRFVGEHHSPVRASRVTKIFVAFDVLSFFVQGAGGGLYAGNNPNVSLAKAVLMVGFIVQLISFAVFAACAGVYHWRARRAGEPAGNWTRCLFTLYAGVALIMVRNIYRTVEFATSTSNTSGFLLTHEAIYYVLEALPILVVCALFLASNPARYIPRDNAARLNGDQKIGDIYEQDFELGKQAVGEDERKGRWMSAVRSASGRA